jgi:hypothetical protein
MENWPNFFIVGAPRAGTTSLYEYLKVIPDIYMSPIKEPNYFSRSIIPDDHITKPIRNQEDYLKLFDNVTDQKIIGEASASYLANPEAPKLIYDISPKAKILIILRDPIDRVYAGYFGKIRDGMLKKSFHDELPKSLENWSKRIENQIPLRQSLYFDDINRYLSIFGDKQVKVIIFEEFIQDPKETIFEILKFLEINYDISNLDFNKIFNSGQIPKTGLVPSVLKDSKVKNFFKKILDDNSQQFFREKFFTSKTKPTLLEEDKKKLIKFFSEDVKKIHSLLNKPLPWKSFEKV